MIQDRTAGPDTKRSDAVNLLPILTLAAFLSFYRLDYQSLWYDEAYTANVTSPATSSLWYIWSGGPVAYMPPLHHTLVYFVRLLLGMGEWALRLPSVLAGILTVALIYATAKYCFNRRVAAFASLIAAVSTFHVYYSQEARAYSLLMLLSIASTYYLLRALREKRQIWWLAYMIFASLGMYTHLFMAFVLVAHNAYLLMEWENKRVSGRAWALSQAVPILVFSPWLVIYAGYYREMFLGTSGAYERATRDYWLPPPDGSMWSYTLGMFFAGFFDLTPVLRVANLSPGWLTALTWLQETVYRLIVPYLMLAAVALWRLRHRSESRGYGILVGILLLLPLLLMSLISLKTRILNPRYFSFAYPYFCIFLALGIDTFKSRGVKTFLMATVIAVNVVGLANYFYDPAFQRDRWREVAALLEESTRPTDVVLVCFTETQIALKYYYPVRLAPARLLAPFQGAPREAWPYLQTIMAQRTRVWLIAWSDFGLSDPYRTALREHCQTVEQPDFIPIAAELYESCVP
jgi:mannosyltransferase